MNDGNLIQNQHKLPEMGCIAFNNHLILLTGVILCQMVNYAQIILTLMRKGSRKSYRKVTINSDLMGKLAVIAIFNNNHKE